MEERLDYLRQQLDAAIADFEKALAIPLDSLEAVVADSVRSGQAQKFEFTIELFWKTAKFFLYEAHGFDLASPKPVVKKYFELGYLDYASVERLLRALDMRNLMSHVYRKESFLELHAEILGYRGFFAGAAKGILG